MDNKNYKMMGLRKFVIVKEINEIKKDYLIKEIL